MPEKKPTRTADLDYFYGQSSELFSFYRIPKLLFQDSRFQPLSTDAKTLYGILLDRMSLSARNGWLDKAGRVFIIYTVQEVQNSLGCADKKATKLLRELEEYGLIERKRRGLGKPDLIYVKNFSSESSKLRFLNRDNDDSGVVQNTLQDPAKLRCNKTERNNTEISDTDPISSDENDWMSEREQLEEYFSQALEVDLLLRLCPDDEDLSRMAILTKTVFRPSTIFLPRTLSTHSVPQSATSAAKSCAPSSGQSKQPFAAETMKGASINMSSNLSYTQTGDYLLPNLTLHQPKNPLGKYGRMRLNFLKQQHPVLYHTMLLNGSLYPTLTELEQTAAAMKKQLMADLLAKNPAPDKEKNQMAWVQHMNSLQEQVEEVIRTELIYS